MSGHGAKGTYKYMCQRAQASCAEGDPSPPLPRLYALLCPDWDPWGRGPGKKPDPAMLGAVEDMSRRLLTEDEVTSVMMACRKVSTAAPEKCSRFR